MARAKGRTQNPKLIGGFAGQVNSSESSGSNLGGLTDRQVRARVATQGAMLHKQLKSNKSTGMKVPK